MNQRMRSGGDTEPDLGMEIVQAQATTVEAITRGEIDIQVATAKRFPRDLQKFERNCMKLVRDLKIAEGCHYMVPRAGKKIGGPSIRLAELVLSNWQNVRAGYRVMDEGERSVTCQGVFYDIESNTYFTAETTRRITTKDGKRFGDDMINVTKAAGCAIALRDAVLKAVPKVHWGPVYDAALTTIKRGGAKDGETPPTPQESFATAVRWFGTRGITADVMIGLLRKATAAEVDEDDVVTLRGIRTALEEGGTTPADLISESGVERNVSMDERRDALFPGGRMETAAAPATENQDAEPAPDAPAATGNGIHKLKIEIANLRHALEQKKIDTSAMAYAPKATHDELLALRNRMQDVLASYDE